MSNIGHPALPLHEWFIASEIRSPVAENAGTEVH